jgi:single-stranded DNA-binding protein
MKLANIVKEYVKPKHRLLVDGRILTESREMYIEATEITILSTPKEGGHLNGEV